MVARLPLTRVRLSRRIWTRPGPGNIVQPERTGRGVKNDEVGGSRLCRDQDGRRDQLVSGGLRRRLRSPLSRRADQMIDSPSFVRGGSGLVKLPTGSRAAGGEARALFPSIGRCLWTVECTGNPKGAQP